MGVEGTLATHPGTAWAFRTIDDRRVSNGNGVRGHDRGDVAGPPRVDLVGCSLVRPVWVEVDRKRSNRAPDAEALGVVTAHCKVPAKAELENKCPDWVNDSLLP